MATQSILKNIVITQPSDAERLIDALEKAEKIAKSAVPCHTKYEDVKGEDIKKVLGSFIK